MIQSVWTRKLTDRLVKLWNEGHSTAEIGRQLGVSKNSVVSKAHRLALSPRASPIRKPTMKRPEAPASSSDKCAWPIGHPGDADFTFCDAPTLLGKPYCDTHARLAYTGKPALKGLR